MVREEKKKTAFKIVRAIVAITFLIIFFSFPYLHNHIDLVVAQVLWYLSLLVIFILGITIEKSDRKKTLWDYIGDSGLFPIIVIFLSSFIINYYNTSYDVLWAVFVFIAVGIPAVSFAVVTYFKEEKKLSKEKLININNSALKVSLLWWLLDLFFISSVKGWQIWPFVFGSLALLLIFYNLTISFLSNRKSSKVFLLQDFVVGIVLTIYLLCIIPNERLQTIMIAIISAVYGGLITLVGVAWTIKETHNSNRNAHLTSIKPMFYAKKYSNNNDNKNNQVMKFILKDSAEVNGYFVGQIKNSGKVEFSIDKITINGLELIPDNYTTTVVEKDMLVQLMITVETDINEDCDLILFVRDVEDNMYKYKVIFSKEQNLILKIKEVL